MKDNILYKNNSIGVISFSGLLKEKNKTDIEGSINNAKEIGLNIVLGKYIYRNDNFDNNQIIENKIKDFNSMLDDEKVKMIIFSRGGNEGTALLDKLNYDKIKATKKLYVGLSDLTCLLNAIYAKTGLITYHFCIFKGFLKDNKDFNTTNFKNIFFYNEKKINITHNVKTTRTGKTTGTLIGGNLCSFCKLLGTEYMPLPTKYILFFEECDEFDKSQVESFVHSLIKYKVLENASGILLGNYSIDNDYFNKLFEKNTKNIPILKCEDFGHCPNNIVLPIGSLVELDCTNKTLNIIDNQQ